MKKKQYVYSEHCDIKYSHTVLSSCSSTFNCIDMQYLIMASSHSFFESRPPSCHNTPRHSAATIKHSNAPITSCFLFILCKSLARFT